MVFEGIKKALIRLKEHRDEEARKLLLEAGVALEVVEQIQNEVKDKELAELIYEKLKPLESPDLVALINQCKNWPYIIVFFGVNGVGKTTAVAKAGNLLKTRGFKPILVAADTFRAGAIEQLTAHALKLGLQFVQSRYGADPASIAYEAKKLNIGNEGSVVLVDTAGRVEMDRNLMDQMKKIVRVVQPNLKVLVVDALTGNAVMKQVEGYDQAVGVDAFVVTKVDADNRGGIFLSLSNYKKPVLFISDGQNYGSIRPFRAKEWVTSYLQRA